LRNNDDDFFKKFSKVRANLEDFLVANKALLTQAYANVNRDARVTRVRDMLDALITELAAKKKVSADTLLSSIGFSGRILELKSSSRVRISDDTKSAVFLRDALSKSLRCEFCGGRLWPLKSVSYDHKIRKRDGGTGHSSNIQMMHPYCNTGMKN
jgi:hypothetical protein